MADFTFQKEVWSDGICKMHSQFMFSWMFWIWHSLQVFPCFFLISESLCLLCEGNNCCLVAKLYLTHLPVGIPCRDCRAASILCPWDFPGKNNGVGCHFLLQGIFPTLGSNPCLLHWRAVSLFLATRESWREQFSPSLFPDRLVSISNTKTIYERRYLKPYEVHRNSYKFSSLYLYTYSQVSMFIPIYPTLFLF